MNNKKGANSLIIAVVICFDLSMSASIASTIVHKNPDSGLLTWTADLDGFSVELIQLLPDFVRAIYAKHEFPKNEVERIANYCVFGTIIKNTSDQVLSYNVSDWQYKSNDISHRVKTKSQWLDEWRKAGIIFSWTLLPDSGVFEVGDWQQGFTTVALSRNQKFDLTVNWQLGDKNFSNTLKDIECPPEGL